jgi:hypothetical protein
MWGFLSVTADALVAVAGRDDATVADDCVGAVKTVELAHKRAAPDALEAPERRLVEVVDLGAVVVVLNGSVGQEKVDMAASDAAALHPGLGVRRDHDGSFVDDFGFGRRSSREIAAIGVPVPGTCSSSR